MKKRQKTVMPRIYYRYTKCPRTDCLFNIKGQCLVKKKEHPEILTFDKDCEALSDYVLDDPMVVFKDHSYFVRYDELFSPQDYVFDFSVSPDRLVRVKVIGVTQSGMLKVEASLLNKTYLVFVDFFILFPYELRRRYQEWKGEVEEETEMPYELRAA